MSRPINNKESWYKVFIKELGTPNIMKSECEEKCLYVYVKAYTGVVAIAKVQEYLLKHEEPYRAVYVHKYYGEVPYLERSENVLLEK